eukprot:scaffold14896_cov111-Isochrysis_galbana.AAC.7
MATPAHIAAEGPRSYRAEQSWGRGMLWSRNLCVLRGRAAWPDSIAKPICCGARLRLVIRRWIRRG